MSLFKNRWTKDKTTYSYGELKSDLDTIKVGQIYKFVDGYHTKTPYYAEVVSVGIDSFTTSIPDYHETIIDSNNWGYHKKRMQLAGMKNNIGHLLLNQKNLVKQKVFHNGYEVL